MGEVPGVQYTEPVKVPITQVDLECARSVLDMFTVSRERGTRSTPDYSYVLHRTEYEYGTQLYSECSLFDCLFVGLTNSSVFLAPEEIHGFLIKSLAVYRERTGSLWPEVSGWLPAFNLDFPLRQAAQHWFRGQGFGRFTPSAGPLARLPPFAVRPC